MSGGVGSVCMRLELALDKEHFCGCNKCDKIKLKPARKTRSDAGITKKPKEENNERAS